MALFEKEGGLMVGAWFKDGANVFQMVGNPIAIPENGYEDQAPYDIRYWEEENDARTKHAAVAAQRAVALKDVSVDGDSLVQTMFDVSTNASSITFSAGGLSKTVSLANAAAGAFNVSYDAAGKTMYVRCALSPDMDSLLRGGQSVLSEAAGDGTLSLSTISASGPYLVTAALDVSAGSINDRASDQPSPDSHAVESFSTVNMRNMAHARQVELSGTGSLAFTLSFSSDVVLDPPVISVYPDLPEMVFPAGSNGVFSVSATDGTLSAVSLPAINGVSATFEDGIFSWDVPVVTLGSRTTDILTNATFTAQNAAGSDTRTVAIRIPWDSTGNGVADDWELRKFGKTGIDVDDDDDDDGFSNYAEYVAGTDPGDSADYVGWTRLDHNDDGTVDLSFNAIPGNTYRIEYCDSENLAANRWTPGDFVTATNEITTWTDVSVTEDDARNYRIRISPSSTKR